jgi:uncharacterized protein
MTKSDGPLAGQVKGDRLLNVDALRGFALLGILAVNIWAFADPWFLNGGNSPSWTSGLDKSVGFMVTLVFMSKFYLLFSFLFGYSFTLQMAAAERAGRALAPRIVRRQLGLLGLGVLHGTLLYHGEILAIYALMGLILLACRNLQPGRAFRVGLGIFLGMSVVWVLLGLLMRAADAGSLGAEGAAEGMLSAFTGGPLATLRYHNSEYPETFLLLGILQGPYALAMFLVGYAAGRVRLFENFPSHHPFLRRILLVGVPLGLLGSAALGLSDLGNPDDGTMVLMFGIDQLTAPLLTASYVILLLRWFATPSGTRLEKLLAPMGRMALTNYLGQSLVLGLLFTGYGLQLVDAVSPMVVLAMVPVIFLGQMVTSRWWLARHHYGPGEWVLRAVTIAGVPPWLKRVKPEDQAAATS